MDKKVNSKFESIIDFVLPESKLDDYGILSEWNETKWKEYVTFIKYWALTASVLYVSHYFFIDDIRQGEEKFWFIYRLGLASSLFVVFLSTLTSSLYWVFRYRIPIIIIGLLATYGQSYSMLINDKIPYIFTFMIAWLFTFALKGPLFFSLFFYAFQIIFQYDFAKEYFIKSGYPYASEYTVSLSTVFIFFIFSQKISERKNITLFIKDFEKRTQLKQTIDLQIDFTNILKKFTDFEVLRRLNFFKKKYNLTYVASLDFLSRVKNTDTVCLWGDVRNFTTSIKKNKNYAKNILFPNTKHMTELATRECFAIADSQADLLFCFWDEGSKKEKLINSMYCAFSCAKYGDAINEFGSEDVPDNICRYIILSIGMCDVGNIQGGRMKITPIGQTINLLQRLDAATKNEFFRKKVDPGKVIMTPDLFEEVKIVDENLKATVFNFHEHNITIRDFSEFTHVYLLDYAENSFFCEKYKPIEPTLE